MCNPGCYSVTGRLLDTYAAALANSNFPLDRLSPKLRANVEEHRRLMAMRDDDPATV